MQLFLLRVSSTMLQRTTYYGLPRFMLAKALLLGEWFLLAPADLAVANSSVAIMIFRVCSCTNCSSQQSRQV